MISILYNEIDVDIKYTSEFIFYIQLYHYTKLIKLINQTSPTIIIYSKCKEAINYYSYYL